MKTATFPSLRVEPELRDAAEDVLEKGESLSAFIENAIRRDIRRRKVRRDFHAAALEAWREVENGAETYSAEQVLGELKDIIEAAERKQRDAQG